MNERKYPVLAHIACDYLAIQGSSVPCGCLFSSAALVDTKWQGNLTSDTFSSIEVVKQYYLKMCRGSVASNSDEYIQFPDTLEDSDPDSELM